MLHGGLGGFVGKLKDFWRFIWGGTLDGFQGFSTVWDIQDALASVGRSLGLSPGASIQTFTLDGIPKETLLRQNPAIAPHSTSRAVSYIKAYMILGGRRALRFP